MTQMTQMTVVTIFLKRTPPSERRHGRHGRHQRHIVIGKPGGIPTGPYHRDRKQCGQNGHIVFRSTCSFQMVSLVLAKRGSQTAYFLF